MAIIKMGSPFLGLKTIVGVIRACITEVKKPWQVSSGGLPFRGKKTMAGIIRRLVTAQPINPMADVINGSQTRVYLFHSK